jgi:hypothetical protein
LASAYLNTRQLAGFAALQLESEASRGNHPRNQR